MNEVINLIRKFVNKEIDAPTFEKEYQILWRFIRDNHVSLGSKEDDIIDNLYIDLDAYCEDVNLRNEYSIDENEFHECAKKALDSLIKI